MSAYCWWTVAGWHERGHFGLKLGPLSFCVYEWDGWRFALCALQCTVFDSGLRAHRE